MQRKALGKGLSALIPDRPAVPAGGALAGVREIPLDRIAPNPFQPRKAFDSQGLEDLAASMKERGVIQPVLVREAGRGFELIAGERRWRAARKAGIPVIPAIVRKVSDRDALELALVENLQREDLDPVEEAEAYARLVREFGLTQEEVAARVGKARATVANSLRLLALPAQVQAWIRGGELSVGHAKLLLGLKGKARQLAAARRIVAGGLTVRQARGVVRGGSGPAAGARPPRRDVHLAAVEEELKRGLGTRVRIREARGRGTIEIAFYSPEERERLIGLFRRACDLKG